MTRDPEAISRFVERFASVLTEGGVARMPARVFALLLSTDDGRLTAAEIAERLQISAAAVSGAIRYLEQVSLVGREREPGSRRDRYVIQHDLWYEAVLQREQLLTRWERALNEGVEALGADTPAGRRLANSVAFFEFLQEEMPAMLARWRAKTRAADASPSRRSA
ncbi:MAG TPA: MarR family transcriptional regulator [Solirubrobacter sp.]|nr:MarR family transcriptional regulator [Solirubrobacter sp.]